MKNLNLLPFLLCLVFIISSCTKEDPIQETDIPQIDISQVDGSDCQEGFDYPNLPESNFLDGYFDLITAEFTAEQLESCDCADILAIQSFRNETIVNFLPFPMTPMVFTCEELQNDCENSEEIDENALVEDLMAPFHIAFNENLILKAERNLMKAFFKDLVINSEVDFDYYWCKLALVPKPEGINADVAGLLSAYTLTFFQSPNDYFTNINPEYLTSNNSIEQRIPRWAKWGIIIATRSKLGVLKKYVDSMGVLIDGVREGQDTSYQALCTALD